MVYSAIGTWKSKNKHRDLLQYHIIFVCKYGKKDLREYCDYRFSIPLEVLCMARQKVEYDFEQQRCQFMYLDDESYDKLYEKYYSQDVIMLTDQKRAENQIDQIIHLLEENAEFI